MFFFETTSPRCFKHCCNKKYGRDGTIHAPLFKKKLSTCWKHQIQYSARTSASFSGGGGCFSKKGGVVGNPKDSKRGKIGKHLGKIGKHLGKMRKKSPSSSLGIAISNYSWRIGTQFVHGLLRELQDFYSYI